ncbi:membrane protein insertion efficiency factor YidD [Kordiimonas sp.]|uniref:membrane protein insertion efficiency factor YidD n=1 Tax=Kordiimonas sp. TaxID=1970157 RepID=UPI003A9538B4
MPETDNTRPSRTSPLGWVLLGFIKVYQLFISPLLGPNCRFQPTCSAYALEAIRLHGAIRGGGLAIRRILKCHPWGGFGYDPVPQSPRGKAAHGSPSCACSTTNKSEEADVKRPHDQGMTSHG